MYFQEKYQSIIKISILIYQRQTKDTEEMFKFISRKQTDNAMQIHKIQLRKLETEHHKPYEKLGVISCAHEF